MKFWRCYYWHMGWLNKQLKFFPSLCWNNYVFKFSLCVIHESEREVAQSRPTLCDLVDCSPPGSSVHGILQARILEWVAVSFSRGSSRPRDRTQVSCIGGRRFNLWATRDRPSKHKVNKEMMAFSNTLDKANLIDIYWIFYPQTA